MKPREPLLADLMLSLVLFVLSASVAAYVIASQLSTTAYLFAHVGTAAAAVLHAARQSNPVRRQSMLLALMTTALGPVGAGGVFLCITFEMCFRPYATPFTSWFASIFPNEDAQDQGAFIEMLHASQDPVTTSLRISSFRDTMAAGTIEQKQALLGLIARRFKPAFSPALRQALNDEVPAIRVQAAAATASIESKYAEKTFTLLEKCNTLAAKPIDHFNLVRHLIDFSSSGIPETQRISEARTLALTHLQIILREEPANVEALTAASKLLLELKRPIEAHDNLATAISIAGLSSTLALLQLEILFSLGKYNDIRAHAKSWRKLTLGRDRESERLRAAAAMWSSAGVAHAS